jgi:hypothetical protein
VLVDGFLAPTWDWKEATGLYSDNHGEAGFTIQLATSLAGQIVAVGHPVPDARHDAHALYASGLAEKITGHDRVGQGLPGPRHHPSSPQIPEGRTERP